MLEAGRCLCQVCHSNSGTEYLDSSKRVSWRLSPAGQAKTTLFTRTIMLYEEWIMLGEITPLNINAGPTACTSISRSKLSLCRPYNGNPPAKHGLAISLNSIRRKGKIEVSIPLCQSIQDTLLRFPWRTHSNQLKVGITDHNNTIGGPARGMNATTTGCQPKLLAEDRC